MEGASSANKAVLAEFLIRFLSQMNWNLEVSWGPTMSDQQHVSKECTDPKRKRREFGPRGNAFRFSGEWNISNNDFEASACRAQDFQEHVERRLVGSNPFSSVTYIQSFRPGCLFWLMENT